MYYPVGIYTEMYVRKEPVGRSYLTSHRAEALAFTRKGQAEEWIAEYPMRFSIFHILYLKEKRKKKRKSKRKSSNTMKEN